MDSRVRAIKTYTVKLCKDWSEKPAWWAPNERKEIKNWRPTVKSENDNEIMKRTVGTSALRSRRQLSFFPPELCRQTPWFQNQVWYVSDQRFRGRNKSQQQPMHCHDQMLKSQPTTLSSRRRSCCPASQFMLRTTEWANYFCQTKVPLQYQLFYLYIIWWLHTKRQSMQIPYEQQQTNGGRRRPQNGWIFGNVPNGLWSIPSFPENHVTILS